MENRQIGDGLVSYRSFVRLIFIAKFGDILGDYWVGNFSSSEQNDPFQIFCKLFFRRQSKMIYYQCKIDYFGLTTTGRVSKPVCNGSFNVIPALVISAPSYANIIILIESIIILI